MFRVRCWLACLSGAAVLLAAACARVPDSYPVPEQHLAYQASGIQRQDFVAASDVYSSKFFVRDIIHDAGPWRWTRTEPELRFVLDSVENRKLIVDFNINDLTFKDTGPVVIAFLVNGRLLGRERYTESGDHLFERSVPADWLRAGEETRVKLIVEPPWQTPDGPLGILLKRAGVVQ